MSGCPLPGCGACFCAHRLTNLDLGSLKRNETPRHLVDDSKATSLTTTATTTGTTATGTASKADILSRLAKITATQLLPYLHHTLLTVLKHPDLPLLFPIPTVDTWTTAFAGLYVADPSPALIDTPVLDPVAVANALFRSSTAPVAAAVTADDHPPLDLSPSHAPSASATISLDGVTSASSIVRSPADATSSSSTADAGHSASATTSSAAPAVGHPAKPVLRFTGSTTAALLHTAPTATTTATIATSTNSTNSTNSTTAAVTADTSTAAHPVATSGLPLAQVATASPSNPRP
jgi:hypothetical protein